MQIRELARGFVLNLGLRLAEWADQVPPYPQAIAPRMRERWESRRPRVTAPLEATSERAAIRRVA